jgi:hypothetical protein
MSLKNLYPLALLFLAASPVAVMGVVALATSNVSPAVDPIMFAMVVWALLGVVGVVASVAFAVSFGKHRAPRQQFPVVVSTGRGHGDFSNAVSDLLAERAA